MLREALEKDNSEENLKKAIVEVAHEDSRIAGNSVDNLFRKYFINRNRDEEFTTPELSENAPDNFLTYERDVPRCFCITFGYIG